MLTTIASGLPEPRKRRSWLLQWILGLWCLGCAIVFCNCFRDDLCPSFRTRLFDDADYVLIAQPHGAVRVELCTIGVQHGFAVAFRRRSIGFPQSGEELAKGLRMIPFNVSDRGKIDHVYLN